MAWDGRGARVPNRLKGDSLAESQATHIPTASSYDRHLDLSGGHRDGRRLETIPNIYLGLSHELVRKSTGHRRHFR